MIRMNDFKAEPEQLQLEEKCAVERVLKSGWYILGDEVKKFEGAWASFCKVKYAIGVGSGLDAIEIGLRALDIGPGDEVITTPLTAFATVLAITRAGATPVFADISLPTALLDPASVERCITNKTKAVLLVHLYGQILDMETWVALCATHGLFLLEDCAQSHGASWDGKMAGTFGAFGAYSFYPTKNLGARGDAGALITNSEEIADRAAVLRNYGQDKQYHHAEPGLNSRLDEMQAAILNARLKWLSGFNARRKQIAKIYFANISNPRIELLAAPFQESSHVYHLFVIRCAERDRLRHHLKSRGIETLIHYPVPAHLQPAAQSFSSVERRLANAERHAVQCLSIPCHPQLSEDQTRQMVEALNDFS